MGPDSPTACVAVVVLELGTRRAMERDKGVTDQTQRARATCCSCPRPLGHFLPVDQGSAKDLGVRSKDPSCLHQSCRPVR